MPMDSRPVRVRVPYRHLDSPAAGGRAARGPLGGVLRRARAARFCPDIGTGPVSHHRMDRGDIAGKTKYSGDGMGSKESREVRLFHAHFIHEHWTG